MASIRSTMFSTLLLTASLISPSAAFWRLNCFAPIVSERADPVVNPGGPSSHLHTIMGGNGFGFTMDYSDTQASTCSSCQVTKDLSNYWVPSIYYQYPNGSFQDVGQVGGATVYYLQRPDPSDASYSTTPLLAFPPGFRMLAGNPLLRSYNDVVEQKEVSYACLGTDDAYTKGFPKHNCVSGLRAQIFFPACWDGVNLDSPDHKSHMAYPVGPGPGVCPDSHPKRFVSLFYEVVWDTNAFKDMWYGSSQPFVLSNGDPTGYSYHGDFVNGWDVPTLQAAVDQCTDMSGEIEKCPVFDFFTDEQTRGCKIPPAIDEATTGVLAALPGCNAMQNGPGNAVQATGCGAPTTIGRPENTFPDLTASKSYAFLGCGTDVAGSATLTGAFTIIPNLTNALCIDFCAAKGFAIAGTEYGDQCYCGNSVAPDRAPTKGLYGLCNMRCAGDRNEVCGGQVRLSLWQKCAGGSCANINYVINGKGIGTSTVAAAAAPATVMTVASSAPAAAVQTTAPAAAPTTAPAATKTGGVFLQTSQAAAPPIVTNAPPAMVSLPASAVTISPASTVSYKSFTTVYVTVTVTAGGAKATGS